MLVNSDHPCRPFLRGGWRNFACAADGGISHRSAADGGISHRSTAAGGISRSRRTAESATEPRRLAEIRVCGGRRNQPPIRGGWRKSFLRPRCPTCNLLHKKCCSQMWIHLTCIKKNTHTTGQLCDSGLANFCLFMPHVFSRKNQRQRYVHVHVNSPCDDDSWNVIQKHCAGIRVSEETIRNSWNNFMELGQQLVKFIASGLFLVAWARAPDSHPQASFQTTHLQRTFAGPAIQQVGELLSCSCWIKIMTRHADPQFTPMGTNAWNLHRFWWLWMIFGCHSSSRGFKFDGGSLNIEIFNPTNVKHARKS